MSHENNNYPNMNFHLLGEDFRSFVSDPTSESSKEYINKMGLKVSNTPEINGVRYTIVRYDRKKIKEEEFNNDLSYLLRSVILANGRIVSISLPKSHSTIADDTMSDYELFDKTYMEEGPMINVFNLDENTEMNGWQFATRSVIGGRNSFFDNDTGNKMSFRDMFLEAMPDDLFMNLDKNSSYSFVIKHPQNRDVFNVDKPYLICVGRFSQVNNDNFVWSYEVVDNITSTPHVEGLRKVLNDITQEQLDENTTDMNIMGVSYIYRNRNTNMLVRTKEFTKRYLELRRLRGTQPKLKFHYLTLRKQKNGVKRYLEAFPEHKNVFATYREEIHKFTYELHRCYWGCCVKKTQPLKSFDSKYKKHIYQLHQNFKENHKPQLVSEVIRYVNTLAPAQLMYCLNWDRHIKNDNQSQTQSQDN